MDYKFLDKNIDISNIDLPKSDKINPFLIKNNTNEITKALGFLNSNEHFLYIHGFLGTGKRQFINYLSEFYAKDVIKLEYYCRPATVCDDILMKFINEIEKSPLAGIVNFNAKIVTFVNKFQQYLSSIKKPFIIILHSLDDIQEENKNLIIQCFEKIISNPNVKIIISTRALLPNLLGENNYDKKIFLKGFSKAIFKEFLESNQLIVDEKTIEDFFLITRGYYYYTALTIKIIRAMELKLSEFIEKVKLSGMNFDSYLGITYINVVPTAILNFFWFLRTIRHGVSYNALAAFDLYDEFSINYLITNLMAFESDETLFVQDYFQQDIDISIPEKTKIKLHKYIISIYEKELKEPVDKRSTNISRQALRAEIEYHNNCIKNISNGNSTKNTVSKDIESPQNNQKTEEQELSSDINSKIKAAEEFAENNKPTEAIEKYLEILDSLSIDSHTVVDIRVALARLYKSIGDYTKSQLYYDLAETYYKKNNENINLNYLYYEMTDLYHSIYKSDRAIETIQKVIYSVDTPQSLMVAACTLLGNIYSDQNNTQDAYRYYRKALEGLGDNVSDQTLAELYFKYALVNDDMEDTNTAFEYYMKCVSLPINNNPYKSLAYSNLGSCYFENGNYADAKDCFNKAYKIEKTTNNYDGIYYTSSYLAKILMQEDSNKAKDFLEEAKTSAEFLNEEYYMMESCLALGDYYYDKKEKHSDALIEYFHAKKYAQGLGNSVDISKIDERINDMKLRIDKDTFNKLEKKYG